MFCLLQHASSELAVVKREQFKSWEFTERFYERKVDPCARFKSWLCNDNSACACSDRLFLTELPRLGEPKCLYGEKLARLVGSPF